MNQQPNSEQQVIEQLRAQLRSKEEDLEIAKRQIVQLRSSNRQPHPQPSHASSDLNIPDLFTSTHGDIQMSVVPVSQNVLPGDVTISHSVAGKSNNHQHNHVSLRFSVRCSLCHPKCFAFCHPSAN
jgi:hypothetical protein